MAAWISRTFFLAKTCMWLDTYIVQVYRGKKKQQTKEKQKANQILNVYFFLKKKKKKETFLRGGSYLHLQ